MIDCKLIFWKYFPSNCNFQKEADSLENPDDDGNDFDIDLENINLDDPLGFTKSEKAEVKDEKKGKNIRFHSRKN